MPYYAYFRVIGVHNSVGYVYSHESLLTGTFNLTNMTFSLQEIKAAPNTRGLLPDEYNLHNTLVQVMRSNSPIFSDKHLINKQLYELWSKW